MAGGSSAALQADAAQGLAEELRRRADDYERMVESYNAAAASERRLEHTLSPLRNQGFHVLADRQWPGSRKAQVDFLVVGPPGVFIVDAKSWRDVRVERTSQGTRVLQGDDDVTDRFDGLISLGDTIADILSDVGLAPGEVHTFAVFTNRRDLKATVSGVELMSEAAVVERILGAGRRLPESEIERVLIALMAACPPYAASATPASVIGDDPRAGRALGRSGCGVGYARNGNMPHQIPLDARAGLRAVQGQLVEGPYLGEHLRRHLRPYGPGRLQTQIAKLEAFAAEG